MQAIQNFIIKNKAILLIVAVTAVILYFAYGSGIATVKPQPYMPGSGGNISPTFDGENAARNLYTAFDGFTSYTSFTGVMESMLTMADDELVEMANAYVALYGKTDYPTMTQNIVAENTSMFWWPWQMNNANSLRNQVLQRLNNLNIY